jgi:RND family efflux transporter MFP subunit
MTDMFIRTLAGLALVGMAVPACSGGKAAVPAEAAAPVAVTVATVGMADVAETFEAGGVVEARTTATLTARIVAPIRDVLVSPGERVRSGQVLIVLDDRDLAAQARRARAAGVSAAQAVEAAESDRQAAGAALALARATHARLAGLHVKRSATAQELDDATGALRAAEARADAAAAHARAAAAGADAARAASEAAETIETYSRLRAPFDGVVTEKMVEPGNMAAPGAALLRIEDVRDFRLAVRVDESRIGRLDHGSTVPVALDTSGDGGPRTVRGTVSELSRAVDADRRAFLVKISLPGADGLRSGMFGRARFTAGPRRALTVPASAVTRRGQLTSVFVVDQGVARLRLVSVSGSEVLAGLSEGEAVILNAPPAITDGRRVRAGGR